MSETRHIAERSCAVCGKTFFSASELVPSEVICRAVPDWSYDKFICRADLATFRAKYVHSLPVFERGELTSLERDVLRSLREHEMLSSNVDAQFEQEWSYSN